jgi:hypothetical protein
MRRSVAVVFGVVESVGAHSHCSGSSFSRPKMTTMMLAAVSTMTTVRSLLLSRAGFGEGRQGSSAVAAWRHCCRGWKTCSALAAPAEGQPGKVETRTIDDNDDDDDEDRACWVQNRESSIEKHEDLAISNDPCF